MSQKHAEICVIAHSEAEQLNVGARLAVAWKKSLEPGAVIYLCGHLGAGKTTFVRGFLRELGYHQKVKSPSYTLIEPYHLGDHFIFHIDLYRLTQPEELFNLGLSEEITPDSVALIEWPEHGGKLLPKADLACYIVSHSAGRRIRLVAKNKRGDNILAQWETALA